MAKNIHEIRDPVHQFVRLDNAERYVLDSRPFQRLRHIHQLALTYNIYPGATHKRFEHSLGVMELASKVFDVVTHPENVTDDICSLLPELTRRDELSYWRRVIRMAALCHDLGHLPFSHAAEKELLLDDWDHERITCNIIYSPEMKDIWNNVTPPLRSEDIAKLSIGPEKAKNLKFTDWETILAEIIVGDAFGADRMDYLLRDSHHLGVAYGNFDHYRLIDTLRILPNAPMDDKEVLEETSLGIEQGGLQSAEALMLARYLMYSQVYFHAIRRIYDIHLRDFLKEWLPDGRFSTELEDHLSLTDNEVTTAYLVSAYNSSQAGHINARRIVRRDHFRVIYEKTPKEINIEAGKVVFNALSDQFNPDSFRHDHCHQESGSLSFPVRMRDGQVAHSSAISKTLNNVPVVSNDCVFADKNIRGDALKWLMKNKEKIIKLDNEENNDG